MDATGTGIKNPVSLLANRKFHLFLIVLLGLALYANSLAVPFYFDDYLNLIDVPLVKNLSRFLDFGSAYQSFGRRYFGYLTFALNYRLNGTDVAGYHLVNIVIHLAAALLVYRLVILTFRTPALRSAAGDDTAEGRAGFVALLAALLFVSHPLQTQAVTYIVQRFASLAAMLYLLSLTCYVSGRLSLGEGRRGAATGSFAAAAAAAILAMATKENAFTLPPAIILYELIFFPQNLKRKIAAVAIAVPVLVGACAAAWSASSGKPMAQFFVFLDKATRLQTDMSRWDYLATQCRVLITYLRLVVLPFGQRIDWDYPVYTTFLTPPVLLSAAFLALLMAAAVRALVLARRESSDPVRAGLFRLAAFGIFWFFLAHLIESGIFPIVDVIFEHRMYLPSMGLFIAVAAVVSLVGGDGTVLPGWPDGRFLLGAAAAVIFMGGVTVSRNQLWRDEVALWEDNAWRAPKKGRVLLHLGTASERRGDLSGAETAYLAATELSPDQPYSSVDLGRIYLQMGRLDEAEAQFRFALSIDPQMAEVHNNIGKIHDMKGEYGKALEEYLLAVRLKPYLAAPHANIGDIYAREKRYPEALREYEAAIANDPRYASAYVGRGKVAAETGKSAEAVADFRRAVALDPADKDAAELLRQAGG